ncbi:hypothetical protein NIES2119_08905 [[Phormidium ambiguum] IAM M-71]|uniref:Uncharacterized protein n=1 Tax=[Phormidium ambiguum] IAM M-71 TaxID=454136 RepID=A0A1U7IN57_9CYAN|nr:hypothetical protein [Phormidium ambiguum]OKH38703.1 hypothetical protein NIES2119_08905 [Phormidium ambiguum IAM M-71]
MVILTGNYLAPLRPFYERDEEVLQEMFADLDAEQIDHIENSPLIPEYLICELWEEMSLYC